jgi:nucleoside 2-deoxyribosyltransferase
MKTVFVSIPMKEGALGLSIVDRIRTLGFRVLSALGEESPDEAPPAQMFRTNVALIQQSDIFVGVLRNYGRDLAAEVGMAYAWRIPSVGIHYGDGNDDVMVRQAFARIIAPAELESALRELVTGVEQLGQGV